MALNFLKRKYSIAKADVTIKNSDVFLVSYPKSGNTWVKSLLGNYINDTAIDFHLLSSIIPDIDDNPEQINNIKTSPRIIKSHFAYTSEYPKVIYIIRDGRDVAVSYYYHLILRGKIKKDIDFRTYFYDYFMKGASKFGGWGEHVSSWKSAEGKNILFVKYENLLTETEKVFREILQFSGLPLNQGKFTAAVQKSSFENMQQTEAMNTETIRKDFDFKDTGYGFIRKGIAGDWKSHFTEEMLSDFNSKYSEIMEALGYPKAH
jgi:hypothetical protein